MSAPRAPRFLATKGSGDVRFAAFHLEGSSEPAEALQPPPPPPPVSPVQLVPPATVPAFAVPSANEVGAHPTPPAMGLASPGSDEVLHELVSRVAESVSALRRESEHLADLARADAIELGFQVAQRILEVEVQARPEALFSLVRGAVRRLGEAREVTVRLSPEDAALVKGEKGRSVFGGLQLVKVRVAADPALARGDCVVESDVGSVDGRLATRLREIRQAVEAELAGPDAA